MDSSPSVLCIGKPPRLGFSFYSLCVMFWLTEFWKFNTVNLPLFVFWFVLLVPYLRSLSALRSQDVLLDGLLGVLGGALHAPLLCSS